MRGHRTVLALSLIWWFAYFTADGWVEIPAFDQLSECTMVRTAMIAAKAKKSALTLTTAEIYFSPCYGHD